MKSYVRDLTQLGLLCALVASCSDNAATSTATTGGSAGVASTQGGSAGQTTAGGTTSAAAGSAGTAGASPGGTASVAGAAGMGGAAAGAGGAAGASGAAGAGGTGGVNHAPCKPEWKLCDGFEGAVPGTEDSDFQIVTHSTATVELATDKFAHGTHSVHIKIPNHGDGDPDGTAGYIAETKTFPAAKNAFWGRMMVFFHPATGLPKTHWANVQASGTKNDPGYDLLRVGGGNKAPGIMNTNQFPPDSFGYSATQVIPVDKWSCWEWQMDGENPAMTNVHFFIDETEISDVAVVDGQAVTGGAKFVAPQFKKVELGFQYWHDDGAQFFTGGDMWLDDVVISDARIHCPAP
jgi:hypothetical protein